MAKVKYKIINKGSLAKKRRKKKKRNSLKIGQKSEEV
jgi:hypothetical protein